MEKIEGTINSIIYRNPDNGYTVLELVQADGTQITVTGCINDADVGENIVAQGEFRMHPVYDMQFNATSYDTKIPEDSVSMLRYLSSGAVKGIGEGLAGRIVAAFGDDSYRIMEEEPERLAEVRGISLKKAMEISAAFETKASSRRAFSFLQQYGISNILSEKIFNTYSERLYEIIRTNPYKLTEDIEGVSFRTADRIAAASGVTADSPFRIRAAILYELLMAEGEGNMCLPQHELEARTSGLIEVKQENVREHIESLSMDRKLIRKNYRDDTLVFSYTGYMAEVECARMLKDLDVKNAIERETAESEVRETERRSGMELETMQREAVTAAILGGVLVMTGGPGTGKTTTINMMLKYFTGRGMDIMLTAPTGRAAKRMTETTGYEASTIHRLLGVKMGTNGKNAGFERDKDNPLETDVIVVDEMSMVDTFLFRSLLRAIAPGTRIILVGDENQLPSVGPGAVLKDIIASEKFKVITLSKIYRQSEAGDIVMNAHKIKVGEQIRLDNRSEDFFFLERSNAEEIIAGIIYLVRQKLPPYVQCSSADIQVMSPMRKGLLGVELLNLRLQKALNPPDRSKKEIETAAGGILRVGDKVMQTRNDYQLEWEICTDRGMILDKGMGVFNGDIGTVLYADAESATVKIKFDDGRQALYKNETVSELELAYAITIHKSQGSEYPAVVIPLLTGPSMLMNRNLLYTGVTRAQKCVVIIGSSSTVSEMISNGNEQKRYTGLKERLEELGCEKDSEVSGEYI